MRRLRREEPRQRLDDSTEDFKGEDGLMDGRGDRRIGFQTCKHEDRGRIREDSLAEKMPGRSDTRNPEAKSWEMPHSEWGRSSGLGSRGPQPNVGGQWCTHGRLLRQRLEGGCWLCRQTPWSPEQSGSVEESERWLRTSDG